MSTIPLGNFYTFPKIVFISKVQLLNLLDRVQRSWAALATIQCGHHTGFPPSVTSPGCRSVVVAAAVIGSHGVAVGHHRAAVGDRTTVGDRAAVDGAPVDAVTPLLPLPVSPTGLGIGLSLPLVDAVSKVGVAAAAIGSHGVAVGHGIAVGHHGAAVDNRAPVDAAPVDPVAPLLPLPVPSTRRGIGQEDAGQNQDQGQGKTHGELVRDIFPPDLAKEVLERKNLQKDIERPE